MMKLLTVIFLLTTLFILSSYYSYAASTQSSPQTRFINRGVIVDLETNQGIKYLRFIDMDKPIIPEGEGYQSEISTFCSTAQIDPSYRGDVTSIDKLSQFTPYSETFIARIAEGCITYIQPSNGVDIPKSYVDYQAYVTISPKEVHPGDSVQVSIHVTRDNRPVSGIKFIVEIANKHTESLGVNRIDLEDPGAFHQTDQNGQVKLTFKIPGDTRLDTYLIDISPFPSSLDRLDNFITSDTAQFDLVSPNPLVRITGVDSWAAVFFGAPALRLAVGSAVALILLLSFRFILRRLTPRDSEDSEKMLDHLKVANSKFRNVIFYFAITFFTVILIGSIYVLLVINGLNLPS